MRVRKQKVVGTEISQVPMDEFQHELNNFNLEKLVRLNAAHAFVATVNPTQLCEISCLSKTLRITPNRTTQVIQPV